MDSLNGALHFDSDIDNRKYLLSLAEMEAKQLQFLQNTITGNANLVKSWRDLQAVISSKTIPANLDQISKSVNNPSILSGITAIENRFKDLGKIAARGTNDARSAFQNLADSANNSAGQLDGTLNKIGAAVAGYFTLQALKNFGSQLIDVTGQFQQLSVAYTTILGSKKKADALFAESVQLAKTTPFTLIDVATSTKQLLAYGFSANEVTATVAKLGDVAAGVSAPLGDIAYLYGTLKTQGRAYAQDIRQFTGRGIPIIQELAKQFETTENNVNKLVEAGKIGFPEIEKAFNTITSAGGQFFNLMEEQSKTIPGQISNLKDSFNILLASIGNNNKGLISAGISGLNNLINNYQKIIDIVTELVIVYGSYRAALLINIAVSKLEALATAGVSLEMSLLRGVTQLTTNAIAFLNSEMLAGAIATAAYTAGIAVIATLAYALTASVDGLAAAQEKLNEINQEAAKNTQSQIDKIASLYRSTRDLTNTEQDRFKAAEKLREITGDRLKQYTNEEIMAGKVTKAIQKYSESLLENAKAAAAQGKITEIETALLATKLNVQPGQTQDDKAASAFANIPTRERLKLTLIHPFDTKEETVGRYNKFLEDQEKGILDVFGKKIDDLNAGIDRTIKSKKIDQALNFQKLLKVDPNKAVGQTGASGNFDALLKNSSGLKDFEAVRDALKEQIETPFISDADITKIKNQQLKLQPLLDKFSNKADLKASNQAENELEKRMGIYEKIGKLQAQNAADNQSQNEKEVADTKAKYDEILDAIDKYNVKAKVKLDPKNLQLKDGKVVNVLQLKQNAVDDTVAKQGIIDFKNNLDAQKIIFEEYEKFKTEVGSTEANKRFSQDLKGTKSYIDYLQSLLKSLDGKTDPLSNKTREFLSKEIPKANLDKQKADQQYFSDLLVSTQTFEQKRQSIIEASDKKIASLALAGKSEQVVIAGQQRDEELANLEAAQSEKIAVLQHYNDSVVLLTRDQAKAQLKTLQDFVGTHNLPAEQTASINATITSLQKGLSGLDGLNTKYISDLEQQKKLLQQQLEPLTKDSAKRSEILKKIEEINAELAKAKDPFTKLTDLADLAVGAFQEMSQAAEGLSPGLKDAFDQMGRVAGIASSLGKIFEGFASGNISGIVGGVVGLFKGIASLFDNSKEKAAQQAYELELQQKSIEAVNKAMQRQIEIASKLYGTERLSAYKVALDDIKKAQDAAQTSINGRIQLSGNATIDKAINKFNTLGAGALNNTELILVKQYQEAVAALGKDASLANLSLEELQHLMDLGKLDSQTAAIVQSMVDLKQEATDTLNALKAETTGTSLDSIGDDIIALFQSATTSAEDFGKEFDKIMQKSILNAFKRTALEKQLQNFYDDFFAATKSGDALTEEQIAKLRAEYDKTISDAQKQFNELAKATGIDLTDASTASDPNSLSAAIQRNITEDTANVLEGISRGSYEVMKQIAANTGPSGIGLKMQLAIMDQQTILQTQIRDNTGKTAILAETINASLISIDRKVSGNNNALAANGRA